VYHAVLVATLTAAWLAAYLTFAVLVLALPQPSNRAQRQHQDERSPSGLRPAG
jgi:hypothetical protein